MKILLISTYDLGHQPFGLASPAGRLRRHGFEVSCLDASLDPLGSEVIGASSLIGFYLPMHTATRLAVPLIERVHREHSRALIVAFGLYALPNRDYLRRQGADIVLGGEFETELVSIAQRFQESGESQFPGRVLGQHNLSGQPPAKQQFVVPDRSGLPGLQRYARLHCADGSHKTVGYVESTRGCKHHCRHCPIVPVYKGKVRVVQREVVLADIRQQVDQGARHISFGDPDFFNGPGHTIPIVKAMHAEFPELSYDVIIKVEHLLKSSRHLQTLRDTGCLFITSAFESIDDHVLGRLEKGHTRADMQMVVHLLREIGLDLSPTFLPFTPWTTLDGYQEMLAWLIRMDLVGHVSPVQLAIRLLIPGESRILELAEVRARTGAYDEEMLSWPWTNAEPRVDQLYHRVKMQIDQGLKDQLGRGDIFRRVLTVVEQMSNKTVDFSSEDLVNRSTIPYLEEPWYC